MSNGTDFQAALDRIAELNREMGRDPSSDPVLSRLVFITDGPADEDALDPYVQVRTEGVPAPVVSAAEWMVTSLKENLRLVENLIGESREELGNFTKQVEQASPGELRERAQWYLDRYGPKVEAKIAVYETHAAAIRSKIDRFQQEPLSMFLPLGTVVRFTDVPTYDNSLVTGDPNKDYPVAGTIGVVTGIGHFGQSRVEYPIRVTVVQRTVVDGWGDRYETDLEYPLSYFADPEKVEVIGHAKLPDGTPFDGYGYVPTHGRERSYATDCDHEMVLEAEGHFWNFTLEDDGRARLIRPYRSIREMHWLTGPLEPEGDEPKGLRP